jgi:heptosyltransferase-2
MLEGHIATFGAAINLAQTAVIQVKPGIGDVIWHLPFIRAIAAASAGGQVTFLAPPSSNARDLLEEEPGVDEVVYFEHGGSELRRGINLLRLSASLRKYNFRKVWILDKTLRPALASWLAGVPERIGLGLGPQRLFITNRGIDQKHFHDEPIDWLTALMAAMQVPLATREPALPVSAETLLAVDAKFAAEPRPWIVLGIAASHPDKDWPGDHWAEFAATLRQRTKGSIFLIGGPQLAARAQALIARTPRAALINASDLKLMQSVALLRHADLFIGPNSGPLNLAAASGTDAFGLFGNTPVLTYSRYIHAVVPEGGPSPDGMARITPADVLKHIEPYLSASEKTSAA